MEEQRHILKPWQEGFFCTDARFPGLISAWATGKTLIGIDKAVALSQEFANNLGMIVRKEFTDLRDSTIKDFEKYTGIKVPANKDVVFDNNSTIMFRHGDEVAGVLQNVNLGWFLIEQAEEFGTAEQFDLLRGRLRRVGCFRCGMVIANANGHNWIYKRWITPSRKKSTNKEIQELMQETGLSRKEINLALDPEQYKAFQAITFDNKDNLPKDFLVDCARMKIDSPSNYNRLILNSHEETDLFDRIIPWSLIRKRIGHKPVLLRGKTVVGCDPAEMGDDETVIYGMKNGNIIKQEIYSKKDPMETAGRNLRMQRNIKATLIGIDVVGLVGISSRLSELGAPVLQIRSSEKANNKKDYSNLRAELYGNAAEMLKEGTVSVPDDPILHEQLAAVSYIINSKGQIKLTPKEKIKKDSGVGQDRSDGYVYACWAYKNAPYDGEEDIDEWGRGGRKRDEDMELATSYTVKSNF